MYAHMLKSRSAATLKRGWTHLSVGCCAPKRPFSAPAVLVAQVLGDTHKSSTKRKAPMGACTRPTPLRPCPNMSHTNPTRHIQKRQVEAKTYRERCEGGRRGLRILRGPPFRPTSLSGADFWTRLIPTARRTHKPRTSSKTARLYGGDVHARGRPGGAAPERGRKNEKKQMICRTPPSFHLIIDEKLAKELESSSRIIGELEC